MLSVINKLYDSLLIWFHLIHSMASDDIMSTAYNSLRSSAALKFLNKLKKLKNFGQLN